MLQANSAISTILTSAAPSRPPVQTVFYLPEIHSKGGSYFPELRSSDTTRATIVADIASAQHDDVRRVIEIDLAAGTCRDVSREIAQAVLEVILLDYSRVPAWCREFLLDQLGDCWVARAEAWDAVA
jgi:hypothetical protein